MDQSEFYVDKTSGTFADSLAAFGLASLVAEVLAAAGEPSRVRIEDCGSYYLVACEPPVRQEWLDRYRAAPLILAPIVRTLKNAPTLPADLIPGAVVDYEQVRDARSLYWDAWNGLPPEARAAYRTGKDHAALAGMPPEPHQHWDVFRALNPANLRGYNGLMSHWWENRRLAPEMIRIIFDMTTSSPNDIPSAQWVWKLLAKREDLPGSAEATAAQLYNPAQGKGQNRAKANSLRPDNVKEFWLLEWLKAAGFYDAAMTKVLKQSKDRKSYVIAPRRLALQQHAAIMRRFRPTMAFSETASRSDVLFALRYIIALLEYSQAAEGRDLLAQLLGGMSARDLVAGFYVAFYKNLGNSTATMNLAFMNLPAWVRGDALEDVVGYLELLQEHERVIRSLDESHSDAYELLLRYRDFIGGNSLSAFFDFITGYAGFLIGQQERGKYAPQFSLVNLRRLLMSADPNLREILDPAKHPGFQNIATAIRKSTVLAQYWSKKLNDRRYDVRYGLNQELARKARYPAEFITALSEFMHKYNAENSQVRYDRPGPQRKDITTSDIDDLVALVDAYGSELICNLLIAYGYARVESAPEPDEEREPDQQATGQDNADTPDEE
jgi:hypothetical protein